MRWDGTSGVIPRELKRHARGMAGRLERFKTSARDKKGSLLRLFVSREAFLTRPWLDTGLGFWEKGSLSFKRETTWCTLPDKDL